MHASPFVHVVDSSSTDPTSAQIAQIVEAITKRMSDPATRVRLVAIAGPTSSGKTTFATKLSMYLRNEGLMSKLLSVDHYYLPLPDQPKFIETGDRDAVDYDSVEAMDIELVNKQMGQILAGEEVMTPNYSFKTGMRIEPGHSFKLPESRLGGDFESILLIEGIHALNPSYTKDVPAGNVFKIYICPQTVLQLDDHNVFKASDQRLLRRMSRDYLFRAHSASRTLSMWPNVRRGEGKWIFPHQVAFLHLYLFHCTCMNCTSGEELCSGVCVCLPKPAHACSCLHMPAHACTCLHIRP